MKETYVKFAFGDSDGDGKVDISAELCIMGFVIPFKPKLNLGFGAAMSFVNNLFHQHSEAASTKK